MNRPFMRLSGKPNRGQGKVSGERIDKAVEKAVEAFWMTFSDEFPEVKTGDMGPGDVDQFEDAALAVARIWIMWNHPDGMPDDIDPTETPPVLDLAQLEEAFDVPSDYGDESLNIGDKHDHPLCRAAEARGEEPHDFNGCSCICHERDAVSEFDHPIHSAECINRGQVGCIPGCPGLQDGGFLAEEFRVQG